LFSSWSVLRGQRFTRRDWKPASRRLRWRPVLSGWWHWINGNVTQEGIAADLEAAAKAGMGGVQLFDVEIYLPPGPVRYGTDSAGMSMCASPCGRPPNSDWSFMS
jgi:hypothetical protein